MPTLKNICSYTKNIILQKMICIVIYLLKTKEYFLKYDILVYFYVNFSMILTDFLLYHPFPLLFDLNTSVA